MRVLLVSDLHYDLRSFDWVVARTVDQHAPLDAVVLAGDLLDVASAVPLDTQITVVLNYLERLAERLPTVVCSGNHDLDHRAESGEKATRWLAEARAHGVVVDGDSLDLGPWRVTACAWWEGPVTLAALEAHLEAAATSPPQRWAWVFHGPPDGPLSWTGSRHYGDPELPRLLDTYAPDLVMCGHVHEAPFSDEGAWVERRGSTWLFNAGRQRGDRPTHVELELGSERATWWSPLGSASVDLGEQSAVADA